MSSSTDTPVRRAAQAVVDNAILTVLARAMTLIAIPTLLAWVWWATGKVSDLTERMAVVEARAVVGRTEILARVERLEVSDIRDREVLSITLQRVAGIDATTQAILREVEKLHREMTLSRTQHAQPPRMLQ